MPARRPASSTRPGRSPRCSPACSPPRRATPSAIPTCGSGSLLIKVGRQADERDFALFGQEMNGTTHALCRMNMFLHGMDNFRIEWGDTLRNPRLVEGDRLMKFDIVVANPPFSLDKWGTRKRSRSPSTATTAACPPKSKGDYAFITHMIETAREGTGRSASWCRTACSSAAGPRASIRQQADRGEPPRSRDRPSRQSLLRHRHPRRHPALQQGQDARRCPLHRRLAASSRTPRTRTACRRAPRQDRRHLRGVPDGGEVRLPRHRRRRSPTTTSTSTSPATWTPSRRRPRSTSTAVKKEIARHRNRACGTSGQKMAAT
jgi:hypothetical protein